MITTPTMSVFTRSHRTPGDWAVDDEVNGLHPWATGMVHRLAGPPYSEYTLGTDPACTIRLDDPSRLVSRVHARLVRQAAGWRLYDLGSKNGLWIDGVRRADDVLQPGAEIGIGGLTLIADSRQLSELRGFFARLIGWSADRAERVDHAVRSARIAITCHVPLPLCGAGDLVPIARSIHRRIRGADRPFIVCDPRRRTDRATVRSAQGYPTGKEALAAAVGGSLCLRSRRLPDDIAAVIATARNPGSGVQLFVCTDASEDSELFRVAPIVIEPLARRAGDLDRIIDGYIEDALRELAALRSVVLPEDRAWVRRYAASSLPEIEKAALRLVALRTSRTIYAAAERLGMAPISLARWIDRRDPRRRRSR